MENSSDIPEAIPVSPLPNSTPEPPPPPPPPPSGNTYKGFAWGCLVSAIFMFVAVVLGIGSCVSLGVIGIAAAKTNNLAEATDTANPNPTLTLLRPGDGNRKIAVIAVHGTIMFSSDSTSLFGEETGAAAQRICRELRAARLDDDVAAVILDMNTPGGEVVASDEIRSAVDALRASGKPVVTCMHTLGASGGYFIASGSDWIIANRLTMTGSVGVIMQSVEASRFMAMIGVQPLTYRSGNFKDMLSPMRPSTPEEDEYLNAMVKQDFREFCQVIANGRPEHFPTVEDVLNAPFADGRVVSGADALEMHLIDQLGDFDDAVAKARKLAHANDAPVYGYSLRRDWKSWLLSMAAQRTPIEVKGLDHVLPGTALQPGVRYYLLPQAAK
ncbi:MAG: signal peptide peptidase SppA [Victivallales bacterium]|nr:signal peptide peptidase SppA [Victivallales bacterium]